MLSKLVLESYAQVDLVSYSPVIFVHIPGHPRLPRLHLRQNGTQSFLSAVFRHLGLPAQVTRSSVVICNIFICRSYVPIQFAYQLSRTEAHCPAACSSAGTVTPATPLFSREDNTRNPEIPPLRPLRPYNSDARCTFLQISIRTAHKLRVNPNHSDRPKRQINRRATKEKQRAIRHGLTLYRYHQNKHLKRSTAA